MKYIKLFEEMNIENVKKYPNLFNIFVDNTYVEEQDYELVNKLLNNSKYSSIKKPVLIGGKMYDASTKIYVDSIEGSGVYKLPENFVVEGDLILSFCPFKSLPKGLVVKGSLNINNTEIKRIPSDIIVNGDFRAHSSKIKRLPSNLKIGGDINLNASLIKKLPSKLRVNGKLDLSNTLYLENLPK